MIVILATQQTEKMNWGRLGKNVIKLPYQKIFGSGAGFGIFFTIFGALIVFLFGLFLYKTLRGNP